ncbi:hypothetical protein NDI85_19820 [Halomicroarcula sp. S1AR25-4]|uniref:hypothetical protein n=1 Tax=Haloarcula sp. S1AR25-4 TaxID=2950538 RepID=UPI0028769F72|nr:hypothetical protein [Halomicroarcula sp. S1AR25-4]MDS0280036.1 hypothetical protein [Halomicroarcula sp. S1AR25-4]
MTLQHRDRITIAREIESEADAEYDTFTEEEDGETVVYEKVEVFNWVNVEVPAVVRGSNTVERFEADIGAGDSASTPDAVTHWLATMLDVEFGIRLSEYDIEVVDVTADEVFVL